MTDFIKTFLIKNKENIKTGNWRQVLLNVDEELYSASLIAEFRELLYDIGVIGEILHSADVLPAFFFSGDENLQSINIPSNIKTIMYGCFSNCFDLTKVTLNEGLETIESAAFENTSIEKIIIPESIKQIEPRAFVGSDIKEIFVPLRYISKFPERADKVQEWLWCNDEWFKKISVEIYG